MEVKQIQLGNGVVLGIRIDLEVAPILVLKATKGFLMCGYLNMVAAQKLEDVAVRVTGVNTFEDALEAKVVDATTKAKGFGIELGMSGREALERLF